MYSADVLGTQRAQANHGVTLDGWRPTTEPSCCLVDKVRRCGIPTAPDGAHWSGEPAHWVDRALTVLRLTPCWCAQVGCRKNPVSVAKNVTGPCR